MCNQVDEIEIELWFMNAAYSPGMHAVHVAVPGIDF